MKRAIIAVAVIAGDRRRRVFLRATQCGDRQATADAGGRAARRRAAQGGSGRQGGGGFGGPADSEGPADSVAAARGCR